MPDNESPTIVKVAPTTAVVISIVFSPALFCGLLVLWQGVQIREGLFLVALYSAGLYWICSPTVELLPGRLVYRALFKQRGADLSGVKTVSIVYKQTLTLELGNSPVGPPLLAFIVAPFSKAGVAAILHHIRREAPASEFDAVSTDMSTGDFASVTRQTLSVRNLLKIALISAGGSAGAILSKLLFHHQ